MQRVRLSPDLEISRLVYGMWRLADDADISAKHVQAKIEACLAAGLTTMDQADIYGEYAAEHLLGEAIRQAPHLAEQVQVVTKCGIVAPFGRYAHERGKFYDTSPAHITASVEHSLRAMAIEQIDMLLIHRPDPFLDHQTTGAALDELVASGKVKCVGVSNFKPHDWTLLQSAMTTKLATNQIEISVVAHDPFTNGDIAFLQERGVPPMAWSPLAGGAVFAGEHVALSAKLGEVADRLGVEISQVALAWLLAHPARIVPVVGTNTIHRIEQLASLSNVEVDRRTWFEIYASAVGREVP